MIFCTMIHKRRTNRTFDLLAMPELSPNKVCQSGNTHAVVQHENVSCLPISVIQREDYSRIVMACAASGPEPGCVCVYFGARFDLCLIANKDSHALIYMQKSGWTHGTDGIAGGDGAHQTEGDISSLLGGSRSSYLQPGEERLYVGHVGVWQGLLKHTHQQTVSQGETWRHAAAGVYGLGHPRESKQETEWRRVLFSLYLFQLLVIFSDVNFFCLC